MSPDDLVGSEEWWAEQDRIEQEWAQMGPCTVCDTPDHRADNCPHGDGIER